MVEVEFRGVHLAPDNGIWAVVCLDVVLMVGVMVVFTVTFRVSVNPVPEVFNVSPLELHP